MTDPRLTRWLDAFASALPVRGPRRRRTVAELDTHLQDAVAHARADGMDDPVGDALRRVGDPAVVAGGFTRPSVDRRLRLRLALALWLPAAVAATVLAGTGYAIGQHVLRSGANDPQIQLAEDAARHLAAGSAPAQVATGPGVDLATSLDVAVAVFGADGRVLASTARLDGAAPAPPVGALQAATRAGMNVVTWQPSPGVRQAAVIVPFTGPAGPGSVVVARSLRLVEQREDEVLALAALGWLAALGSAALVALLVALVWTPPPPPPGVAVPAPAGLPPPGRTAPGTLWRSGSAAVYRWSSTRGHATQQGRGPRPDSSVGRASPW